MNKKLFVQSCQRTFSRRVSILLRLITSSQYFNCTQSHSDRHRATKSVVIALGGNAIKKPSDTGTADDMLRNVEHAATQILNLYKTDPDTRFQLCITHGNGPQVGALFLQNQMGVEHGIPALPLTFCGAMTEGYIGYMLQQCLYNQLQSDTELRARSDIKGAVTVINQVGVSMHDTAFHNPSKPIGKFYTRSEADKLAAEHSYTMMEDSGRGYRITVGSPKPLKIMELDAIRHLIDSSYIVVCAGGGGVPVIMDDETQQHKLYGMDAVIDKDLTTVLLASEIKADLVVIATDGDGIWVNYGKPDGYKLDTVEVTELERLYASGVWDKYTGSMKPKITAVLEFVKETAGEAIICDLNTIDQAMLGKAGTKIYHKDSRKHTVGNIYK